MVALNNFQLEKLVLEVQAQQESFSEDMAKNVNDLKDAMKVHQFETSNNVNSIKTQQDILNDKVDDITNAIKSASANSANQFTTLLDQIIKITVAMTTQNPFLSPIILPKGINCPPTSKKLTSGHKDKSSLAEAKIDINPDNTIKNKPSSGSKIQQLPSTLQLNYNETYFFDAPLPPDKNSFPYDASPKIPPKYDPETEIRRYSPNFFFPQRGRKPSRPFAGSFKPQPSLFPTGSLVKICQ